MGKHNKPVAKPKTAGKHKPPTASDTGSATALFGGAFIAVLLAVAVSFGINNSPAAQRALRPLAQSLDPYVRPLLERVTGRKLDGASLTAEQALHEGRLPSGHQQRAKCIDRRGAGCADVGEREMVQQCEEDPEVKARCCATCHKLTCIDHHSACEEWALKQECIDNPEYMMANCCYSCSPDPDDPCSTNPSRRPDVHRGDITKIFERALAEFPQYPATVHHPGPRTTPSPSAPLRGLGAH